MKKLTFVLICLVMSAWSVAFAQTAVTGTVISEADGQPIIGASVLVKGTTIGTITDFDGRFTLQVPTTGKTLVFSYVGMSSKEESVKSNMRVSLSDAAIDIDEVVVIAYGTQSIKNVTSAVSSVKADAFKDVPSISFDQMLQGRASGVQITTPSAGVGQAPVVRVRGVNSITSGTSPLYVVDGMPMQSGDIASLGNANALADINPTDIVSMEVLKDASAAAMYGSRAANGVILITTKQGQKGQLKVSYDGFVGVSNPTGFYDMMNAQQYVDFKNMSVANRYGTDEMSLTKGYTSPYGKKAFNLMPLEGGKGYADTRWRDAVFQDGFSQSQSVSIGGGTEKAQYYVSTNYTTQNGIVKGDKYNRLGFKANITAKATDWLKIGINTNATTSTTSFTDAARNGSNFSVGGFPRLALINVPNVPMFNADGSPYFTPQGLGYGPNTVFSTFSNPAALLELGNGIDTDVNRLMGSMFAEINPIKNLVLRTQYGIDYARTEDRRFWSPLHGDGYNSKGLANNYAATNNKWTWSNTATYDWKINNHNFNFLLGMEAGGTDYSYWYSQRSGLADPKYSDFQGPFISATSGGAINHNTIVSYFGRVNYDFASRYLLSVNYRRDGYSALSKANRWGDFGGVSAAWRISDEGFFEGLKDVVDDLKIKGSFGVVGNTNILDYASKLYYSTYYYGSEYTYGLGQVADPNLKWESSSKYDIGFSAQLLNRITVDFDYYYTKSSDLILEVPQAPSKGIPGNKIITNSGTMRNSGIELTIGADVIKNRDFTWNTNFNIATNSNKVIALADGISSIIGQDNSKLEQTNITIPGYSIGQLNLYPTAGVDPASGRRVAVGPKGERFYIDYAKSTQQPFRNQDGSVYEGDWEQAISGNTLPTWYGGWMNNFKYKQFDLSLFFQFSGGNYIYNGTKASTSDMRYWNNSVDVYENYWTPERTNATYPIPVYGDNYSNGSAYVISDWVEKGDYLRLKNVSFGYTFDTKKWSKAVGISNLRLYVQAQNLFVLTGYSGMDPEALTNVKTASLAGGVDKNTMPQARTYTFGINLSF